MGSLWRSAPMQLVQLFIQLEAAHDTVDELGQLGSIQFLDLNPDVNAFHRNFVNEVKRCDEMERKLRFFEEQVFKEKALRRMVTSISLVEAGEHSAAVNVDELEARFDDLEKDIHTFNNNQQVQDRGINEVLELMHVLSADSVFFAQSGANEYREEGPLLGDHGDHKSVKLQYITGTVARAKLQTFERILWRATRGNLFMRQTDIPDLIKDPHTGDLVQKHVFIVFMQGDRLHAKVKKICESFGATIYPCPDTEAERSELLHQLNTRLEDLKVVLQESRKQRLQVLANVAQNLQAWKAKVMKEKAIYHALNLFNYDVGRKCLIGEGWCPEYEIENVQQALRRAAGRSGALVPSILNKVHTTDTPPTHFETNKYTHAYQEIVNAYGMAHYREVNPAVVTLVTFPFLFGIMFGDVGHGIFLLAFSLLLIFYEKQLGAQKLNEIVQMPFDGRYVLVIMSFYAIYVGFIYNEFFSIPMDIFGTSYDPPTINGAPFNWTNESLSNYTYTPKLGKVYPFGVDPMWKGAPNELDYYNSFKMKLSILLGILQMSLGIFISCMNYSKEKKPMRYINIFFQFLPQIIFLWAIFGYMCFLILIKWATDFSGRDQPNSILPIIINMFLSPLTAPDPPNFFPYQHIVQLALTGISIICIPIMLLAKPLYLRSYYKSGAHHRVEEEEAPDASEESLLKKNSGGGGHGHGHGHGDEFDFAEIMIHQIIHTIEFILGCISNTASYLRLWALSLAHSELSTVFWNRILLSQIQSESIWRIFVGFSVWAAATFAVLLVMETLSAFLHALRLHWVEFQNKFYVGDGVRFLPFSYKRLLAGTDD